MANRVVLSVLLAGGSLLAAPAHAQTAAGTKVDEIVVTAQRREQRLQDVGIAVTALNAKTIASLGLKDSTDLTRVVPSLKLNAYTPSAVVFNIRGVSQNDFGDEQEPPVAIYQDDSYCSSFICSGFPMFDLARVEALRGPQGTLFGRNATGGAVQFISQKPTKDFEAYAKITYGSYNEAIEEGAISGPITDNVQMRLSGMHDWGDGYLQNIIPGAASRGAENHYALRDIVEWQPTNSLNVELELRYARNPHENSAGMYSWEAAYVDQHGQGTYLPANELNPSQPSFLPPCTKPGADFSCYVNSAIDAPRGGDPFKVAAIGPSYTDRTLFDAKLKVDWRAGIFNLTSITDYQSNQKAYLEDASAAPPAQPAGLQAVSFSQGGYVEQYSEEIRAAGDFGAHHLTVGAFGMDVNGRYTASYAFPSEDFIPDVRFKQDTKSYAFFAQDEWQLPDNFKAIVGARYWHDNRVVDYLATDNTGEIIIFNPHQVYAFNGTTGQTALQGVTVTPGDADKNFSDYSVRAELDYKPTRDLLLYASYNRGTKSGGFTLSTSTPTAGFEASFINGIPYKPEVLHAFEVGVKASLPLNTTFNASAFYYGYHNYQAFAEYGLVETVINLPAHEEGLEVEITSHPIPGLTLQANSSSLDNLVKNVPLPDGTIENSHFPQAPKTSLGGLARYDYDVGPGSVSVQTDVQYTGRFCFSVLCAPVEHEAPHTVVNARVGFVPTNKRWEAAVFVNNIGQEVYRVYTFDVAAYTGQIPSVYARPRTWGVTATYHFGG
jgi:iron complex outermembrane receptor protein